MTCIFDTNLHVIYIVHVIYMTLKKGSKSIMNKVKNFRTSKNMSQLTLARSVEVSRQTINMIENDKYNPSLNLCIKISKALDVTLNDLFWEDDNNE